MRHRCSCGYPCDLGSAHSCFSYDDDSSLARLLYNRARRHQLYLLPLSKETVSTQDDSVAGEGSHVLPTKAGKSATLIQLDLTAFPFDIEALFSSLMTFWVERGSD
jgi:hypothetical protein